MTWTKNPNPPGIRHRTILNEPHVWSESKLGWVPRWHNEYVREGDHAYIDGERHRFTEGVWCKVPLAQPPVHPADDPTEYDVMTKGAPVYFQPVPSEESVSRPALSARDCKGASCGYHVEGSYCCIPAIAEAQRQAANEIAHEVDAMIAADKRRIQIANAIADAADFDPVSPGGVCRLLSGGPLMTITRVYWRPEDPSDETTRRVVDVIWHGETFALHIATGIPVASIVMEGAEQ